MDHRGWFQRSQGGRDGANVPTAQDLLDQRVKRSKAASGISVANGKIAKDQAAGKLTFTVGKTMKPGDYNFEVTAQMRLNNQNITVKQPVIVKVTAAQ